MRKLAVLLVFMFSSFLAQANIPDPYYQISDMTIEVLDSSEGVHINSKPEPTPNPQVGDVIATVRQIIAFGKEIYKIVVAGKPVINTEYAPISVLPLETEFGKEITPMDLSLWQPPKFMKFKVTYKNGLGAEVVSFTYNINMSHGGKFRGKGSYITHAQIVPENVSVAWGYTFNAQMSLVGLTNLGTEENPIAGATIQLSYTVSTVLKEDRNNMMIFIAGDGTIQAM
ncbi:MAG: hypothetical protein NDI69_01520 [Bacteriovoracaceae bacterium]|nr:hypothetical protein [Bacteriovoracaceae bacterium]